MLATPLYPFFNTTSLAHPKEYREEAWNYPWVQLHGCLFIFAYLLFNSTAMVGAHFLRHFAPNTDVFNHRIWFVVHAIFNGLAVLLIAFGAVFVIFGYQWTWPSWNIAHWSAAVWHIIAGAISLVLIVLQVVGGIGYLSMSPLSHTFSVYHPVTGLAAFTFAVISLILILHTFVGYNPTTKILVGGAVIGIVFLVEWITMKTFQNKSLADGETTALLIAEENRRGSGGKGMWQSRLFLLVVVHALLMTGLSVYLTVLIFHV